MIPELLTGEPSLVVERIHELPTLPDIYQRLSSTIDKPFSSIWEIDVLSDKIQSSPLDCCISSIHPYMDSVLQYRLSRTQSGLLGTTLSNN